MLGKKFKSQFFIIATAIFILIFSVNFFYFGYLSKKTNYSNNLIILRTIDNYLIEANFLLENEKYSEFFNFSEFFINTFKKRNLIIEVLFLNISLDFSQKKIRFEIYLFSEREYFLNISSDKDFLAFNLEPRTLKNITINFENSQLINITIFNSSFFIVNCKSNCKYLISMGYKDDIKIIKSLLLNS